MHERTTRWLSVACLAATACAHPRVSPPEPTPEGAAVPASPQVDRQAEPATQGQWSFRYLQQSIVYRVMRDATIEAMNDTTSRQELSTNLTRETLILTPISLDTDSLKVSAVVDTFATTNQGKPGNSPPVQTPFDVGAILSSAGLTIATVGDDNVECSPAASVIVTDLYNVLPRFPDSLRSGLQWTDTVRTRGCQAGIPTTSESIRVFTVIGQVIRDGRPAILIERSDSVNAGGQGMQQQHQISVGAAGNARAQYYLDAPAGRVMFLTLSQTLRLMVNAEARQSTFRQTLKEEFVTLP